MQRTPGASIVSSKKSMKCEDGSGKTLARFFRRQKRKRRDEKTRRASNPSGFTLALILFFIGFLFRSHGMPPQVVRPGAGSV
jgi:hypothetical protein